MVLCAKETKANVQLWYAKSIVQHKNLSNSNWCRKQMRKSIVVVSIESENETIYKVNLSF